MNDAQIKHMVNRFLAWRLPEGFNPDGGVSFKSTYNEGTPYEGRHQPVGTNLLSATQAEAMIRHLLEGVEPAASEVHTALKALVDECREAIKTEEWDSDNLAYNEAARLIYPERYDPA